MIGQIQKADRTAAKLAGALIPRERKFLKGSEYKRHSRQSRPVKNATGLRRGCSWTLGQTSNWRRSRKAERVGRPAGAQAPKPNGEESMAVDDLKKTASDAADSLKKAAVDAADSVEAAKELGRKAAAEGYEHAREYAERGIDYVGGFSENLADFVAREPWMAIAGAFVVGYVSAQILRRVAR